MTVCVTSQWVPAHSSLPAAPPHSREQQRSGARLLLGRKLHAVLLAWLAAACGRTDGVLTHLVEHMGSSSCDRPGV